MFKAKNSISFVVIMLMLGICLVMAQFAQAGTVTFSGRDWTTNEATHRDDAGISNSYVVNNAESMTMTGVYGLAPGVDTYVVTPISVSVGDVVSYDYYLTKEMRDPVGDGDTNWIGDSIGGPKDAGDAWVFYAMFDNGYTWLNTWAKTVATGDGWIDVSLTDATAPATGIHFEYVFDSTTQYTVTVTAIGNSTQIGSWTDNTYMTDITLITQWRQGLWDSEQDVTIENFTHTHDTSIPILTYPLNEHGLSTALTLEWSAPTEYTPDGYNIYIDPNETYVSTRDASVKYNTVPDTDVDHAVTGLVNGTRYYWLVEAVEPDGIPPDPNFFASNVATFMTASGTTNATWKAAAEAIIGNVVADDTGYVFDGAGSIAYDFGQLNVSNTAHDDGSTIELIFNLAYPTVHYDTVVECVNWNTDVLFLEHETWVSDEGPGGGLGASYKGNWDWPHPSDTYVNDEDVHVVWRHNGDGTVIPGQTTAGSMNLFVNGVDFGNWGYDNWWLNGGNGYLGGRSNFGFVTGTIESVATYDNAISATDIRSLAIAAGFEVGASNPDPAPGATGVEVDDDLYWDVASYAAEYQIYLDPNETKVKAHDGSCEYISGWVSGTTTDPGTLVNFETTYYWQIVTKNTGTSVETDGPAWYFTTDVEESSITTQPVGATVGDGAPVDTLAVSGTNITNYQWYRNGVPVGTDASYDIAALAEGDEGVYYCVVSNGDVEDEKETDYVVVMIKNDLASPELYYSFDADDFTDDSLNGWDGTAKIADPNELDAVTPAADHSFTSDAVSGRAVTFGGVTSYVDIVGSEDALNFYPQGFTASCWVKNDAAMTYDIWGYKTAVAKMDGGSYSGWAMGMVQGASDPNSTWAALRDTYTNLYTDWYTATNGQSTVNGYKLVVMTYDPVERLQKLHFVYANQYQAWLSAAVGGEAPLALNPITLKFGCSRMAAVMNGEVQIGETLYSPFAGSIDEVKIWNYKLSDEEIAGIFTAEAGGWVCTGEVLYDFDGDCKVGLSDFAMFVQEWLNDNRVY